MHRIQPLITFISLLLIPLLCVAGGSADEYVLVKTKDAVNALSDNRVNVIYKDSDGFVWMGTGTMVLRLDGSPSLSYGFNAPADYTQPSPYLVHALSEGRRHELWAGTDHGLWKANHVTLLMDRAFADSISSAVLALDSDADGNLYIGTARQGVWRWSGGGQPVCVVKSGQLKEAAVLALETSSDGEVYLLTTEGVGIYGKAKGELNFYPAPSSVTAAFRSLLCVEKTAYVGTEQGQVLRFDLLRHRYAPFWKGCNSPVVGLDAENDVLAVATDGEGLFVLGLPGGETRYTADYMTRGSEGFLTDCLSSVLVSADDIWCGTGYYNGFNLFCRRKQACVRYTGGDFVNRKVTVRAFLRTDRYTFIGTREGFYYVDERTGQTRFVHRDESNSEQFRSNLVFSFHPTSDGQVLVGTCGGGLSLFDPRTGTFGENALTQACRDNDVFMFLEEREAGLLWLATTTGLWSYDRRTGAVRCYNEQNNGMPGRIVYCALIDNRQRFWVGTDRGAALFDRSTGQASIAGLPQEVCGLPLRYVEQGRDGTLLFCLLRDYLVTVDNDLRKTTVWPDVHSSSITQDKDGCYWVGSNDGLFRLSEKLDEYVLYPALAQLAVSPGPKVKLADDGYLWVCTQDGLYKVDPDAEFLSPPVRVTGASINGRDRANYYALHDDSLFTFDADEQVLTFRFFSLGYGGDEVPRHYQCRLEGVDTAWVDLKNVEKTSYFNLAPGDYRFRVRAFCNPPSEDVISFRVQRGKGMRVAGGMFIGAVVCVLCALALMAYVVWARRKRAEQPTDSDAAGGMPPEEMPAEPLEVGGEEAASDSSASESEHPKAKRIPPEEAERIIAALRAYMESDHRPYLRENLKQSDVATDIGCTAWVLSTVLTQYLQMNYYDYINSYRIEYFCRAVERGEHKQYMLMGLAERCGFSSKSSFFRAFKKFKGMTPKEYIIRMKNDE